MMLDIRYLGPLAIGQCVNVHVAITTSRGKMIPIRRKDEGFHLTLL